MRQLRNPHIVELIGIGCTVEEDDGRSAFKHHRRSSEFEEQIISVLDSEKWDVPLLSSLLKLQYVRDFYIVQEYCPGGSLRDLIVKQMSCPWKPLYSNVDAVRWMLQVAKALQYLHGGRPKLVHRDMKCDNILLTQKSPSTADAKLADFGLARGLPSRSLRKSFT